ncbi:MAG TPA: CoA-binding protein [Dehalococcoidia bacterium]|nr:CoA-binding protein [Dehalococcoidia bacterium]
MTDYIDRLERAFNPKVVAVVGDKRAMGYMWLNSMKAFSGKLYSVQIDPAEIPGIEALDVANYPSLNDIPDDIDYVLCAVPRPVAARIVADCATKKVGAVALFTSGFAETETEEGIAAQEQVTQIARDSDLLLIGPNCMGIYNRELGVRHSPDQEYGDAGNVGFISQSGTHCINFSLVGATHGIKCSKTVSFGNAVLLDAPDYIDYLAQDAGTGVIAMYIEGVKDGPRLLASLKAAAATKPVIVWRGGTSAAGSRAVYSHTASLAAAPEVWHAAMRQAGVIETHDLDETIDVAKALVYCKPTTGRRMGLVAMTGGQSVVITDAFEREGMDVPLLTAASYEKLASFFNIIGGSYRNPLDAGGTIGMGFVPDNLKKLFEILDEDETIDAVAMEVSGTFIARRLRDNPAMMDGLLDLLAGQRERSGKAFLAIAHPSHVEDVMADVRRKLLDRGVATFTSFRAAARAMNRATAYWASRD